MNGRNDEWGRPRPMPSFPPVPARGVPGVMPSVSASGQVVAPPPAPLPQVQISPWWLYEYESATDFFIRVLNVNIAGPGAAIAIPGFTFTVPGQQRGVLKSISMTVQSSTAAMNLQLTLLKNGAPIQGWAGIPFPPILATGENIVFNGMNVRFAQNDVLTAQMAEIGGVTWVCSFTANGWTVPSQDIDRLQSGVRY